MLGHLFKLAWNKKKQNFLISLEVFISFIVLFAVFTLLVYGVRNYRQPMGFNYEDSWIINVNTPDKTLGFNISDTVGSYHDAIEQAIRSSHDVVAASFTTGFNTPFTMGHSMTDFDHNQQHYTANNYMVDDDYVKALDLKMVEGRWFDKRDDGLAETPVVINQALRNKAFKNEPVIGKILTQGPNKEFKLRVIGVVNDFKDKGDYLSVGEGLFVRMSESDRKRSATIILRMKPGSDANAERRIQKALNGAIRNADIQITHLTDQRKTKNKIIFVPLIIILVVCGFLIINVGLGLFGILWYNINKRRSEIGLRRAIGATGSGISTQMIGEALAMATIALFIGLFFTVQFPLLNVFDLPSGIYITAIALSAGFIYLLVILCALYPGRQAAKIYPAVALHED